MKGYEGSCQCGTVKFAISGPFDSQVNCHCTQCQRAHGAPFVSWGCAKNANFTLQQGEDSLRWFDSSAEAQRGFCQLCGSTMFFRSSRWPGETDVTVTNLHDFENIEMEAQICFDTHASWVEFKDNLPRQSASELGLLDGV